MTTKGTGTFEKVIWDESPYEEHDDGQKLTRAKITNRFAGDISGDSTLEYLMAYPSDDYASFVGLERIDGKIGDRRGSFVLQHQGTFDGLVRATWFVVPGSGTGDLRGLRGEGGYVWDGSRGDEVAYSLDYAFDDEGTVRPSDN
ncbi:MAG TPA: DUF3224 domain-containing protein [Thermomicrobiales bacterium]|nr:DUF3224 domain-containing protein [Thermomicrobiales bacterium]